MGNLYEDEYLFELRDDDNDEEGFIRYHFFKGFPYVEILMFLEKAPWCPNEHQGIETTAG